MGIGQRQSDRNPECPACDDSGPAGSCRPRGIAGAAAFLVGQFAIPVALGRGGIQANKREGDGGTPGGRFRPRRVWWRPDRGAAAGGPCRPAALPRDAWCEDPADRLYNRPFRPRPDMAGDRLWRTDHLYDILIETRPQYPTAGLGRGSAIFIHLAPPDVLRPPDASRSLARIEVAPRPSSGKLKS